MSFINSPNPANAPCQCLEPLSPQQRAEAIFSLENMSFAYAGGKTILDNVNFALFPGKAIGLCGDNGSGKTSFFRCIAGLLKPRCGKIHLGNQEMRNEKDFQILRRQVGLVLQDADDQLFFPSVLEDIAFGPLNLGMKADAACARAEESLAMVGLDGFGDRLTHQLSGGEKKLVALAAILAMRPKALLLDEPANALDEKARLRLEKVIMELDCAKVIIAHELPFLQKTCGEIIRLSEGKFKIPQGLAK